MCQYFIFTSFLNSKNKLYLKKNRAYDGQARKGNYLGVQSKESKFIAQVKGV